MGVRTKKRVESIIIHRVLTLFMLICVFPILWMYLISVKDTSESISGWNSLRVNNPALDNYRRLFSVAPIWKNAFSSVLTMTLGAVASLSSYFLVGFTFAKHKFPGRNALFCFAIAATLVPPEVGAASLLVIMKKLNLINSLRSLVTPRTVTAAGIFYVRQYIIDIPDELIEVAHIDGCSNFEIFVSIVIPVIKPALAPWVSVMLTARQNDFLWLLPYLHKQVKYTLMIPIFLFPASEGLFTPQPVTLVRAILVIIPITVLHLLLQTFQKAGLTAGAIKG